LLQTGYVSGGGFRHEATGMSEMDVGATSQPRKIQSGIVLEAG
jgi:hypothetical protein